MFLKPSICELILIYNLIGCIHLDFIENVGIFVDCGGVYGPKCMKFLSVVDYGTGYVLMKENVKNLRLCRSYGCFSTKLLIFCRFFIV